MSEQAEYLYCAARPLLPVEGQVKSRPTFTLEVLDKPFGVLLLADEHVGDVWAKVHLVICFHGLNSVFM